MDVRAGFRYNTGVVTGGQTLPASEFARRAGVSRERLRNWERRFGFPAPQRVGTGPRRYAAGDLPAVVAVREAAARGVPLPEAISAARSAPAADVDAEVLGALVDHLPAPLLVLSGPLPVRVVHRNAILADAPGAPPLGAEAVEAIPWFAGSELEQAVEALFAGAEEAVEVAHPAWTGSAEQRAHSIAYRLPPAPGRPPLVAIATLDRARDREARRELAELERFHEDVVRRAELRERWLATAAALAQLFRDEGASNLLRGSADALVRRLGAIDAGVAVYMGGELAVGSSSRTLLGPRMVTVTAHEELAAMLRDRAAVWLAPSTARAFGVPPEVHLLAAPVVVVGETLGALLLVFDARGEIDSEAREMLAILSTAIGFILLRERLVEGARADR
jgi:DNA-binding transcriptional MerR regulator